MFISFDLLFCNTRDDYNREISFKTEIRIKNNDDVVIILFLDDVGEN